MQNGGVSAESERSRARPGAPERASSGVPGETAERRDEPRDVPERPPDLLAGRSYEHWLLLAGGLASPLVLLGMRLFFEPDPRGHGTHEQLGLRPCWTMEAFEVPCPGCGVTTATTLAVRGRLLESLETQPLGVVMIALGLVTTVWSVRGHARGRDLWRDELRGPRAWRVGGALLVLMTLAWIWKLAS